MHRYYVFFGIAMLFSAGVATSQSLKRNLNCVCCRYPVFQVRCECEYQIFCVRAGYGLSSGRPCVTSLA